MTHRLPAPSSLAAPCPPSRRTGALRAAALAALVAWWEPASASPRDSADEPEEPAVAAGADEEMAALQAAEAAALARHNLLDLDRATRLLGPANPLRARIRGSLELDASEWPAVLEAPEHLFPAAGRGQLPFPVEAVSAKYDIPVEFNDAVAEYVAFFQGPGRRWFVRWMERSGRWVPLFREILREHEVPEDLVYLSMIESGYSMYARSWAEAVGPWQFIATTGAQYGLRNDFWVDERQDPVKSTHAAARFLKWLHRTYGDWYLAWAGYNAGPGRVQRAVASVGSRDFWELARARGAFHKETQHYVPKLIAAALISKHPEHFGFTGLEMQAPLAWETVEVPDATDLEVIARAAGVTLEEVKELNPELRRWATPPVPAGGAPYRLRIPAGSAALFAERIAELDPAERFTFRGYEVRQGESLAAIATAFGTTAEEILRVNEIADARSVRVGQQLVVPVAPHAVPRVASLAQVRDGAAPPGARHHVLKAGETLGHVALRYGTSVDRLKRLNNIRDARKLQIGQRLRVR